MGYVETLPSGRYKAVARVDGKRVGCGSHETDWEAELAWREVEQVAATEAGPTVEPSPTVYRYLVRWCYDKAGAWSKATSSTNGVTCRFLATDPLGKVPVAEVTKRDLDQAVTRWVAAGTGAATIRQRFRIIRAALHDAYDNGVRDTPPPTRKVRLPFVATGTQLGQCISDTDVAALLDGAERIDPQWRAFLALSVGCGLRFGEAAAVTAEQFLQTGMLQVDKVYERDGTLRPYTKDQEVRWVPVPDDVQVLLRPWLRRARLRRGPVFTMPGTDGDVVTYDRWRHVLPSIRQESGLRRSGITHKDLRHTFITRCRLRGVPIAVVMMWVGHASEDTTKGYTHTITADLSVAWQRFAAGQGPSPLT